MRYTVAQLAQFLEMTERGVRKVVQDIPFYKQPGQRAKEYDLSDLPQGVQQKVLDNQRRSLERLASIEVPDPKPNYNQVAISHPEIEPIFVAVEPELPTAIAQPEVRTEEVRVALDSPIVAQPKVISVSINPTLPSAGSQQMRRDAKLALLALLNDYCEKESLKPCECRETFSRVYNRAELQIPDWLREIVPSVSARTLDRWLKLLQKASINDLAGQYGKHRKGTGAIESDPEIYEVCIGMILHKATHIYRELVHRFPEKKIPDVRTIQRWVKTWRKENPQEWALLQSKDLFNSKYRAAHGSQSEHVTYALQELQIDATKGDILLADGTRYSLLLIEDVFSRRLKFFVCKTSSAKNLVQGLLRRTIIDWGIPDSIKTDRGKEFLSAYFLGCLESLNIQHKKCNAFSPWEKPMVERAFGTNTRDLLERLQGFCGHNVSERRLIEARDSEIELKITPQEFQSILDDWCSYYEQRPHRGEGLEGKTPLQRWAESPQPIKRIASERSLDILLAEMPDNGGIRICQKKGIAVNNGWYADAEGLWTLQIGKPVAIRFDPLDDNGKIYCFEPGLGGQFLFVATDSQRLGESRQDKAENAHKVQREVKKSVRQIRQIAKVVNETAAVLPTGTSAHLYAFPLVAEEFSSQSLRAAQDAIDTVRALEAPAQPKPLTKKEEQTRQHHLRLLEDLEELEPERPADRYQRLFYLRRDGAFISADDLAFMERYESTSAGRTVREVLEDDD